MIVKVFQVLAEAQGRWSSENAPGQTYFDLTDVIALRCGAHILGTVLARPPTDA